MIRKEDFRILCDKAKMKHEQTEVVETKRIPNSLILKLTTRCNIACEYCYMGESTSEDNNMSAKTALYIIDKFDQVSTMPLTIYLHGGEPCLRKDLIETIGEAIVEGKFRHKITLMLQTNATLIDDKLIDMINKYNINVGISLDGVDEKTNYARHYKNNQNIVEQAIKGIKKLIANNIEVGVFGVLTKYNVNEMQSNLQTLSEIGVKSFVINPLVLWGNAREKNDLVVTKEDMIESYKKVIDWIGEKNRQCYTNGLYKERNIHWWYYWIKTGTGGYMCNCSPCGAGIQTLAFSPKGDTYICDQYYGDEKFCLGNILEDSIDDILLKVSQYKLRNVFEIEECKTCKWRFVCSGGCSANSYYYSGNMNSVSPFCEANKEIFDYMESRVKEGIIL